MEWINEILGLPAQFASFLGVVLAFVLLCWRWGAKFYHSLHVSHGFRTHFGDDPASKIRSLLEGLRHSATAATIKSRIIAHHLDLGLYICEPNGRCNWTNDVLQELFGRDSKDMLGFGWIDALEERTQIFEQWMFAVENGLPYTAKYTIKNERTGDTIKAMTKAFAAMVDDKVICYVGYVTPEKD